MAVRLKNESKMTIDTYKTLYDGSLAFGMRKTIESKEGLDELNNKINEYKKKKELLKSKLESKQIEKQNIEKYYSDVIISQNKKNIDEIDFLKHQNQELDLHLKTQDEINI